MPVRLVQPLATPVDDCGAGLPLHDRDATRALEAVAPDLMQRAGVAIARLALALAPHARRLWIVAGPGNNGGDGLEAAALLQQSGRDVTVSLAPTPRRPAEATRALDKARAAGVRLIEVTAPLSPLDPQDLVIDALFGLGLTRPAEGWARQAIEALQRATAPVLAVDLPSGLDGDRGVCIGSTVQARWTLSLLTLHPGLFTAQGRDHAGMPWFDTLGVDASNSPPRARLVNDSRQLWPTRRHAQHKGSFGDVWTVGGAPGMLGAARLAAAASLVAGAGRAFLVPLDPAAAAVDPRYAALMHRPPESLTQPSTPLEAATIVCGCGGSAALQPVLAGLIARAGRLLLDADALNHLAHDAALAALMHARAARGRPTLLTPHPLEAARLLGIDRDAVQSDRLQAAEQLAERWRATVVLKGSGTVIATPGERSWINGSGNAALATAGTGDVLAGWIGGLWSQGLSAAEAARLGVHSHGLAADHWVSSHGDDRPLGADTLVDALTALARH